MTRVAGLALLGSLLKLRRAFLSKTSNLGLRAKHDAASNSIMGLGLRRALSHEPSCPIRVPILRTLRIRILLRHEVSCSCIASHSTARV